MFRCCFRPSEGGQATLNPGNSVPVQPTAVGKRAAAISGISTPILPAEQRFPGPSVLSVEMTRVQPSSDVAAATHAAAGPLLGSGAPDPAFKIEPVPGFRQKRGKSAWLLGQEAPPESLALNSDALSEQPIWSREEGLNVET